MMLAPGARRRAGIPESGDETKYDGRHMRDTFRNLQRLACAALILVAIALLAGDGLMIRSKLRARRSGTASANVGKALAEHGGIVAANPALVVEAGGGRGQHHQSAQLFVDQPEEEAGEAEGSSGDDLAAAWAGGGGEEAIEEELPVENSNSHHASAVDGKADPALAELAEAVKQEAAAANGAMSAEQQKAAGIKEDDVSDDSGKGGRVKAASVGDGNAQQQRGLNEMADPNPSWALNSNTDSCDGYFGNGYTRETVVLPPSSSANGGSTAQPKLSCRSHPGTEAYYCSASEVILHPDRIKMSRGGEDLEAVMGRDEDAELPAFNEGALEFYVSDSGDVSDLAAGHHDEAPAAGTAGAKDVEAMHLTSSSISILSGAGDAAALIRSMEPKDPYKARMLKAARVLKPLPAEGVTEGTATEKAPVCHTVVTEPVIIVTRVEYANLFHTSTGACSDHLIYTAVLRASYPRILSWLHWHRAGCLLFDPFSPLVW